MAKQGRPPCRYEDDYPVTWRRRIQIPILMALAGFTVMGCFPLNAPSAVPDVSTGFENGFNPFKVQAIPGRAALTRQTAAAGRQSVRFEVRPGEREPGTRSQRAELYLSSPLLEAGQTLRIRDSIRLAGGFVDTNHRQSWRIVQQLHEADSKGSPGLAVFVDPGPRFGLRSGTGSPSYWRGPVLRRERWYRLEYTVHLSSNPTQGWVRVWLDGKPQVLENGSTVMRGVTIRGRKSFLKLGLYRSPYFKDTSVLYHDDVSVKEDKTDYR
jgi:polysaccharide lyase-like protein